MTTSAQRFIKGLSAASGLVKCTAVTIFEIGEGPMVNQDGVAMTFTLEDFLRAVQ